MKNIHVLDCAGVSIREILADFNERKDDLLPATAKIISISTRMLAKDERIPVFQGKSKKDEMASVILEIFYTQD